MADYELPSLLAEEPTEDEAQEALIAALRRRMQEQGTERSTLQANLGRQQGEAGTLRSLALLTSLGTNPQLQGVQRQAAQQGAQLEGLAGRTEARLGASRGMDPLSLARLQQGERRLGFQQKTVQTRLQNEAERLRMAAAGVDAKAEDDLLTRETGLRKEFNSLPEVKTFNVLSTSYANLQQSAKDPSGPGGIATIFNFMKLLDPGVAVMEGDVNLIRSSGGPAAKYAGLYDQVLTGNPLPGSVRKDILRQADTIYATQSAQFEKNRKRYEKLAAANKVAPDRVVATDDRPASALQRTGAATLPTPAAPAGADTVRVLINGKPRTVQRANLEAVKKIAAERGDKVEVPGG